MWNLKKQNKPTKLNKKQTHTENKLVVARVEGGWGRNEMGEGGQGVRTPRCKINKPWVCNVQHRK